MDASAPVPAPAPALANGAPAAANGAPVLANGAPAAANGAPTPTLKPHKTCDAEINCSPEDWSDATMKPCQKCDIQCCESCKKECEKCHKEFCYKCLADEEDLCQGDRFYCDCARSICLDCRPDENVYHECPDCHAKINRYCWRTGRETRYNGKGAVCPNCSYVDAHVFDGWWNGCGGGGESELVKKMTKEIAELRKENDLMFKQGEQLIKEIEQLKGQLQEAAPAAAADGGGSSPQKRKKCVEEEES